MREVNSKQNVIMCTVMIEVVVLKWLEVGIFYLEGDFIKNV